MGTKRNCARCANAAQSSARGAAPKKKALSPRSVDSAERSLEEGGGGKDGLLVKAGTDESDFTPSLYVAVCNLNSGFVHGKFGNFSKVLKS